MAQEWQRWNTHHSTAVEVELFGTAFRLAQDPSSHNLGTTVWDASIVFAKWLERNCKRGEWSRQRLRGRRALELGAGMGLCGLALAALGADVLSTDLAPVLPLLRANCEANLSTAATHGVPWAAESGRLTVQELDWAQPQQRAEALMAGGPFDVIVAADCVYSEEHLPAFRDTCLALMTPKTTLAVVNELRSEAVHALFLAAMAPHFSHKKVLHSRMAAQQHAAIDILLFKRLKAPPAAPPGQQLMPAAPRSS